MTIIRQPNSRPTKLLGLLAISGAIAAFGPKEPVASAAAPQPVSASPTAVAAPGSFADLSQPAALKASTPAP